MYLPALNNQIADKLRKDLRNYGMITKSVQIIVGVVFGIAEGILINMATGAKGAEQSHLFMILAVIAVVHLFFFGLTLFATTPLPQFLVEFDDIMRSFQEAEAQTEVYSSFTQTYNAATIATQMSLSVIEARRLDPRSKLDTVLGEIMAPWLDSRTEVFRFQEGDALYNFAFYEYLEQPKRLKSMWRSHDNRLKVRNREWEPGSKYAIESGNPAWAMSAFAFSVGKRFSLMTHRRQVKTIQSPRILLTIRNSTGRCCLHPSM